MKSDVFLCVETNLKQIRSNLVKKNGKESLIETAQFFFVRLFNCFSRHKKSYLLFTEILIPPTINLKSHLQINILNKKIR